MATGTVNVQANPQVNGDGTNANDNNAQHDDDNTAANIAARSPTISYQDLLNRPRSNQRSRTPNRYESPLNADAFRRDSVVREDEEQEEERRSRSAQGTPTTVRPLIFAGAPVGGALRRNIIREENRRHRSQGGGGEHGTHHHGAKSSKQGPSKRKVRRWNNDSFTGLANEFANRVSVSSGGVDVAELYLKAQADAPKHLSVYQPTHPTSCSFQTMFDDAHDSVLKDKFWKGEVAPTTTNKSSTTKSKDNNNNVPDMMLKRVHGRLRNILHRMHTSSRSVDTINNAESFVIGILNLNNRSDDNVEKELIEDYWNKSKDCLHEKPKVIIQQQKKKKQQRDENENEEEHRSRHHHHHHHHHSKQKKSIRFTFKKDVGLSRLFLHAVCQFHKLEVTTTLESKDETRCLIVSGKPDGVEYRLMDMWKTRSDDGSTGAHIDQ